MSLIALAPVSYLSSLVVRAVHRHRTVVGSIAAGMPYFMINVQLFPVRILTCV